MADWFDIGGSALSAIGGVAGGVLGRTQSTDGFSQKGAWQQELFNRATAKSRGKSQAKTLLHFAKYARIHPLAALGNFEPSSPVIAGQAGDNSSLGRGVSDALRGMGQDISNAEMRNQDRQARALGLLQAAQDLHNTEISGQILMKRLRDMDKNPAPQEANGSQGFFNGEVIRKPAEVIKGKEGAQHGANPSEAYFSRRDPKTGKVVYFRGKGEKFTEATEEDFAENLAYNIHKGIVVLSGTFTPPYNPPSNVPLKKGYVWKWNTTYPYQGWYQGKSEKTHWKEQRTKGEKYYQKGGKYYPPPKTYKWKERR